MKKLMSIILCVALLLGVCTAASASSKAKLELLPNNDNEDLNYEEVIQNISNYLNKAKDNRSFSEFCSESSLNAIKKINIQADIVQKIINDGVFSRASYTNALKAANTAVQQIKIVEGNPDPIKFYNRIYEDMYSIYEAGIKGDLVLTFMACMCKTALEYHQSRNNYLQILNDLAEYIKDKK